MKQVSGTLHTKVFTALSAAAATLLGTLHSHAAAQPEPGDYWLRFHDLQSWEWPLDHDGDGLTAEAEHAAGTDPRDPASSLRAEWGVSADGGARLLWTASAGAAYRLQRSSELREWSALATVAPGPAGRREAPLDLSEGQAYFRLEAVPPADGDEDRLSDVEESLLGTDRLRADTDGDGLDDGTEVHRTFTDPLVPNPAGGAIRGTVKTDPNEDGVLTDGQAAAGVRVFLDLNFDGTQGTAEPWAVTDKDGRYYFSHLRPGLYHVRQELPPATRQTLPAGGVSPVPNRVPDEVISYTHADTGALPVPYGRNADPWKGLNTVIFPVVAQPVDPSLVTKPIGDRALLPAAGVFSSTEFLALPNGASIVVRFDERIVDGPGSDLQIVSFNSAGELAEISLGATLDSLAPVATIGQTAGASGIDLADHGIAGPVQFVRLKSLSSAGSMPGFDLAGFEAIHIAPPTAGSREVVIVASETVEGVDFGRAFRDDPPLVFLEAAADDGGTLRAGQPARLAVIATDDIAVQETRLEANGTPVALDALGRATITPDQAGLITFAATAVDSAGQPTTRNWNLYVADASGTLTFDPSRLGPQATEAGAPALRLLSPAAGAVVTTDTPVVATTQTTAGMEWSLDFAPVDQINPYALAAEDADYQSLGSGTGPLVNQPMGIFPAATLPDGIYFLRAQARPAAGGPTAFTGQVIAKGVDEASLRPVIAIDSPPAATVVTLTTTLTGSITGQRPLREWYAEYAPAAAVDPNDLGRPSPAWVRFASGTQPVNGGPIAVFDATRVPNGTYTLRVVAWNDLGLGRTEALTVEVTGEAKLGRLRREFTDLSISLAGFPLEVRRVYDSLNAHRSGDFGHGWSLALGDAEIAESVPATGTNLFGATPFRSGTRVYLSTADGRRIGFTFRPELAATSFIGALYRARFDPDPGVPERLEVPEGDTPFLTVDTDGHTRLFLLGLPWNPDRYVLTTPDQKHYTHHQSDGLLQAEDANGQRLDISPLSISHSSGLSLRLERDPLGRITAIVDPEARRWTYDYDASGNLIRATDPDGMASTLTYLQSPAHYLQKVTDPLGRTGNTYEYGPDGKLAAIIDAHGHRTEQTWDLSAFSGTLTDRRGNVTRLEYDVRGNLVRREEANGAVTRYEYGNEAYPDLPTAETNALGQVTRFAYDTRGNLTTRQPPISFRETYEASYDELNRLLSRTEYRGLGSTFAYDEAGNVTEQDVLQNPRMSYAYSPEGRLIQSTTESGFHTWWQNAPDTGLPARVWDENGFDYHLAYDRAGILKSATGPRGESHAFTFDASGLPATQTDPLGRCRTATRLPDGDIVITDRLGGQTRYRLAADRLPEKVTYPDGAEISAGYDPDRNLASVTDPLGHRFSFVHDAQNNIIQATDAAGASERATRDLTGRITEFVDRNGRRRTFVHDANGRRTAERWHAADGSVIREIQFTWTQGRLARVTDAGATWEISGFLPRPSSWTVTYPGQTPFSLRYSWTDVLTRTAGPTQVILQQGNQPPLVTLRAGYFGHHAQWYSWSHPEGPAGHLQIRRQADGLPVDLRRFTAAIPTPGTAPFSTTLLSWDLLGAVGSLRHLDGGGVPIHPQAALAFSRDAEGRIQRIEQPLNTADYTYDSAGQIVAATHSAYPPESYSYDTAGNRLTSHHWTGPALVDPGNRLRSAGHWLLAHDAAGNVVRRENSLTGEVTEFLYDHRNRLQKATVRPDSAVPPATVIEFDYDFLDRMTSRTVNGTRTWILYDRTAPIAEFRDGSTTLSATYFHAIDTASDVLGEWREGTGARWFLKDHIGSVRGVIDGQGSPVGWVDYDACGSPLSTVPDGFGSLRHAGRQWIPELKLYDNGRRFFDPVLGRFTQEDPWRFQGGDFNLYRYAGNNPLSFIDPNGTLAAMEYVALVNALVRPSTFCSFATCVADLWEGVTNAVVNRQPAVPNPSNCGLKLLPAGGIIEDWANPSQGRDTYFKNTIYMGVDLGTELLDRGPGAGLAGPTWEMIKLAECLYQAQK